jgi:UDP-2-acetamido-3-amino-2,3-dideoxy-glucuronate N-acetyltransferase
MHPTPQEKALGLMKKFIVAKSDGSDVDPAAVYFVLRLDDHDGCDPVHAAACRAAAHLYADAIEDHLPLLSRDLRLKLAELDTPDVQDDIFVHPLALCESKDVGSGTRVWAFAHVMQGAIIGKDCNIGEGVFVEAGAVVGNRVTLKNHVLVWDGVTIRDDVFVGPGAVFTNDKYPRSKSPWTELCTTVHRGASIGAGAVILPGITIGHGAMIGAGAVVTKSVAPNTTVIGNPAHEA